MFINYTTYITQYFVRLVFTIAISPPENVNKLNNVNSVCPINRHNTGLHKTQITKREITC